ncbi:MAG TPA: helix-turn-helix domain-containing protein [Acidimicrobiales bacterium]|jgi:excisionase family DNA binding protein|nr:helix-turn-helix domain-containing protein [Acidimicrobiales bacterium]
MARSSGWLSTTEVRDRLGITLRTLYRLIDEGQIEAYKIGRVIRMKEEDVADFLTRSRIEPGSLEHLYPAAKEDADDAEDEAADEEADSPR